MTASYINAYLKDGLLNITWSDPDFRSFSLNQSVIRFASVCEYPKNSSKPLSELAEGRTKTLALFLDKPLPFALPETLTVYDPDDLRAGFGNKFPSDCYGYWFYGNMETQLFEAIYGFRP